MNRNERPRSKQQHLSTQRIGGELLIYDEVRHQAFCLNSTSAAVFSRADGLNTIRQIASGATLELAAPITEDMVSLALRQLQADGLVEELEKPVSSPSRREMIQKLGVGAALMLPVVAAVMAPQAAQAYSGCVDCNISSPTVKRDLSVPSSSPGSTGSSGPALFTP